MNNSGNRGSFPEESPSILGKHCWLTASAGDGEDSATEIDCWRFASDGGKVG